MAVAELAVAQRQLAIAAQIGVEDLHVARAVHRLDREVALLRFRREHALLEVRPMAGLLPERPVEDLRALHFLVPAILVDAAHVLLDLLPDRPSLRVPEHHSRRLVLQMEEIELAPEPAVIALFGFLDPRDVRGEIVLVRPGGPVDPLQHLVARIAAPVRARDLHQLEDLELAGRRHVRPAAEVGEPAFGVERDVFVRRDRRDDLGLVVLAERLEVRDRVVARHELARHRLVLFRELGHLLLDRFEILGRERALVREVVVEPVLDHRADRHLRVGEELLHRIGEKVRSRMTKHLEALGVLVGDDGERRVAIDPIRGVDDLAVDLAGKSGLGKAGSDRGSDFGDRHRRSELLDGAVGQLDFRHGGLQKQKSADEPHFSVLKRRASSRSLGSLRARSRCHNHAFR